MLFESVPGEDKSETSSLAGVEVTSKGNKQSKGARKKEKKRRKLSQASEEAAKPGTEENKDKEDKETASASAAGAAPAPAEEKPETAKKRVKPLRGKHFGFTEDQMQLMGLIMKMVMQLMQGSRDAASAIFDTFLAPSQDVLIQAMAVQGRRYAKAVESPGHGLSSPHLYVFGALLKAIADLKLEAKDQTLYDQYESFTVEQRAMTIRLCKQAKTYDAETRKMVLAFGSGNVAQEYKERVLQVLIARENWSYKVGRAPPSHMEREMSKFLENMVS
jgi:hypothetical protein